MITFKGRYYKDYKWNGEVKVVSILLIAIVMIVLCGLGILERKRLNRNVKQIPLRINVNGIRGKSTATRFITAILQDAGYQVVGKTTGTSARLLVWNQEEEKEIKRHPVGANIGEQVAIIKETAKLGANALVCECMAVKPEYQDIYQNQIIQANIVVITNVVEDHLDEMGPTTEQIAWAFEKTIPHNGILVITEGPYADYFKQKAAEKNTKVICIDPETVENEYLEEFPYIVFKNNCAVGLGVAEALGIDRKSAEKAMLKAKPDPGIAQIVRVKHNQHKCVLINAFAANEPTSSLEIWGNVQETVAEGKESILVLSCRDDRIDRSHQFIVDFLPHITAQKMLVIGSGTKEVIRAYKHGEFPNIEECIDLTNRKANRIIEELDKVMEESVVFCAGNIHGVAENFLEDFAAIRI